MTNHDGRRGRGFVAAMIAMGALAPTTFVGLPEIVGQVARQWGFAESLLGIIVFAEIVGMTAGTLLVGLYLGRCPVRWTLGGAVLLAVAGNLLTPLAGGSAAFMLARGLAGAGCGAMNGIAMRYLSYTPHAERHLGLMVLGQALWSTLLLAGLLPAAGAWHGATGCFLLTAGVLVPFGLALRCFGARESLVDPAADAGAAGGVSPVHAVLALMALLMLYVGVGIVWTFVERVGADAGFSPSFISGTLGAANLMSMPACMLAPRLARCGGLRLWTPVLLAGCGGAAASLGWATSATAYAVLVVAFLMCWSAAAVLLFATVPRYDSAGRYVTLSPGFLGLGFGLGALAGGQVVEFGSVPQALAVAGGACGLAVLLYAALRHVPLRTAVPTPAPTSPALHETAVR